MKIGRRLTNVIASVSNARRPPATPPANRLARASGRNPEAVPPRRDRCAGAEPEGDQGGMAERHDADDDPARADQRQDADDRDVDSHDAEDETNVERSREDGTLLPARGGGADRRSFHARFFAMRSPMMPYGRKMRTIMSSVKAMRSRNW